jgi:hypothetical protein
MPKYHWLPFFDWLISGSRFCATFFVEGGAAISVASTIVPPRSNSPFAAKCSATGEDRLRQVVTLEQMAEVEDRRLVGDSITAELQSRERAHRLDIVERLLGARIGEAVPLLQAVDAQHGDERERPAPALRAHLRIMRGDQRLERIPRHDGCHLSQKHIPLRPLLLRRLVERRKAQLVGHRRPPRINGISLPRSRSCSEVS